MCTLTYIPGKEKFILTSNRDEHESRGQTVFPEVKTINNANVYFPQDPKAGGTWIAGSDHRRLYVLLNGAFGHHKHAPPYRKSRGLILLEAFEYRDLDRFAQSVLLDNIEPFTLIHFNFNFQTPFIEELKWDGQQAHLKQFPGDKPTIWSSAQLYSKDTIKLREAWFSELLDKKPTASSMLDFHRFGGNNKAHQRINLDLGKLRTISISQILVDPNHMTFNYQNLVSKTLSKVSI